jgi:hypothetical protein
VRRNALTFTAAAKGPIAIPAIPAIPQPATAVRLWNYPVMPRSFHLGSIHHSGAAHAAILSTHGGNCCCQVPASHGANGVQVFTNSPCTLKLICVSGYPSPGDDGLACDFLSKLFSREDLLAKVREVLDRP